MNNIIYVGRNMTTFTCKQHFHEEWELVYCTGGQGRFEFEDSTIEYTTGDLVIIPPHVVHANNSEEGFTNIHINITDATFNFKEPLLISDDAEQHIMGGFKDAFYFFNSDINSRQSIMAAFGDLIVNYVIAFSKTKPLRDVVDEIKSNIMQNFTDCDYELDSYLRSIPFSYDYLRKLFKSEMGMTPHSYLTNLRIHMAEKLLCSPDTVEQNISEIAYICGYSDSLYFSRVFKKNFGCSPKNYAAMHSAGA
ncbi:helix-turn-helix domain-containing protein [uncultured Ruminococcus sp.]|uniref:helix-turn-helix domain-containing protein n=1 Tax=uncultured Ruminococcus sp. TaxID=165186 RepID=UPI0025EC78C2|nr:helix-turn-helix domain-containing protein [uncultured Ruminococcus sp.]